VYSIDGPYNLESPNPEGAAIVLEALTKIPFGLKTSTSRLRKEAETIKKHLNEFMKMSEHQIGEQERASSDVERMYK
jgi:predicted ATP-grasp superfamily ATP-dependent carboligase